MTLPTNTWVPGQGPRPDDAWLDEVEPAQLIEAGVRLFELGLGFEAHEAWERAWHTAKRDGDHDRERMLRALIRLAAASVKLRQGNLQGVRDHSQGARALLEALEADAVTEVALVLVGPLLELARRVETTPPALVPVGRPLLGLIARRTPR